MTFYFLSLALSVLALPQVRTVTASECDITKIYLAIGMTTQLVFDMEPRSTLFADKEHFQIQGAKEAPRRLAIIPLIRASDIHSNLANRPLRANELIRWVDRSFKTNLFVLFDHNQQFMFELRFVPKEQADFAVRMKRGFGKDCNL